MRAYQLKIIIKDSKPSIYRRCRIPDGLTFSQFSVILNEIIGLEKADRFYFEFCDRQIRISELEFTQDFETDNLEASTTLIHRFMQSKEKFYYFYSSYYLKENEKYEIQKYEIQMEKMVENYYKNYPEVIEVKTQMQNYSIHKIGNSSCYTLYSFPEKTDKLIIINQNLEKNFKILGEKKDSRKQKQIYQDYEKGTTGLFIWKTDKDTPNKREVLEGLTEQMNSLFTEETYEALEEWRALSLKEIYDCYTKQDIIDIGKMHRLKKYSNYKKKDLIEYTIAHLLNPETMQRFFLCLRENEIEEFENALQAGGIYRIKDIRAFGRLLEAGYCGIHGLEIIDVPDDVKEVYAKINTLEFHKKRKQRSFLIDCFLIAGVLYGAAPIHIILKMYHKKFKTKMEEADLIREIEQIPEFLYDFIVQDNLFIHKSLLENKMYQHLQICQGDRNFYIPSAQEIKIYAEYGYFAADKVIKDIISYFQKDLNIPENIAEIAAALIQQEIGFGCQIQDIDMILEEYQIEFINLEQQEKWIDFIKKLQTDTRMIINRGYKKEELKKKTNKKNKNIIEFKDWKEKKIYPNDSCPCGSKRKFKDCCKKKNE